MGFMIFRALLQTLFHFFFYQSYQRKVGQELPDSVFRVKKMGTQNDEVTSPTGYETEIHLGHLTPCLVRSPQYHVAWKWVCILPKRKSKPESTHSFSILYHHCSHYCYMEGNFPNS